MRNQQTLWQIKVCVLNCVLRRVPLFVTPWTAVYQAPLSVEFSSKNIGVGCHFLSISFPTQGSSPRLLHWQTASLPLCHQGIVNTVGFNTSCYFRIQRFQLQSLKTGGYKRGWLKPEVRLKDHQWLFQYLCPGKSSEYLPLYFSFIFILTSSSDVKPVKDI